MKVKTAYRSKKPNETTATPAEPVEPAAVAIPPEPEVIAAAPVLEQTSEPQPQPAAATDALRARIAETERAMELNRQAQAQAQAAMAAAQPLSREQLLDAWRHSGVSAANLEFLERNPELIDGWQLTTYAANEAVRQGHKIDTDAHREATKKIFHEYLGNLQEQASVNGAEMEKPPEFFRPPQPRQPRREHIVSAPVSREMPNRVDPNKVHLSADEVEAARIAGVSVQEYARQKQLVEAARRRGELQVDR